MCNLDTNIHPFPSPGRFYAAAAMKTIIGQFILKFDAELVNKEESRFISWRSFIYPRNRTKVVFKLVQEYVHLVH
jgi:hypothetical protein